MKRGNNIDNLFSIFNEKTPGCAMSVVQKEEVILEKCYGLADLENKSFITPDTAFRLASLTKPFTAMAIMILRERGLLDFDDTIIRFFSDFPSYGRTVSIRQLLTHTSGMPDHEEPLYASLKKGEEPTIYNAIEVFKSKKSTLFKPGTCYQYSDAGFVMLALIIEKVSGEKYSQFLTNNIFIPLGMSNTVIMDETKPTIHNRAYGYQKTRNIYKLFDYDQLNFIIGNEGIYSTIKDLVRWRKAWSQEILVHQEILQEALIPQKLNSGKVGRCGFSWFLENRNGRTILFHDGFWVGFNTIMLTETISETTVIILSNTTAFPTERKRVNIASRVFMEMV